MKNFYNIENQRVKCRMDRLSQKYGTTIGKRDSENK